MGNLEAYWKLMEEHRYIHKIFNKEPAKARETTALEKTLSQREISLNDSWKYTKPSRELNPGE